MKPWKIIAVAAFAVIIVALITTTAFAYMSRPATNNPYGTYNPMAMDRMVPRRDREAARLVE